MLVRYRRPCARRSTNYWPTTARSTVRSRFATASTPTPTLEECREEFAEVLEEWLLFHVYRNRPLPAVGGIELRIKESLNASVCANQAA